MESDLLLLVLPIALFVLLFAVAPFLLPRLLGRLLNGSKKKQEAAEQLAETGKKAHATIISIQSTGTVVNRIYYQCELDFRLQPVDESAPFDGRKTVYVPVTEMPRVGDVWPSWYDPNDRTAFSVGRPDFGDPKMQQILREFEIPNPLDAVGAG